MVAEVDNGNSETTEVTESLDDNFEQALEEGHKPV